MKKLWRFWAKAIGDQTGNTDQESDRIAFVRTLIVLSYITTNCFIIAGVVHQWCTFCLVYKDLHFKENKK